MAREQYPGDGDPEIDSGAPVSLGGDPGAYVQAWVWVYNPECSGCGERIEELEEIPKDVMFQCKKCKKNVEQLVEAIRKEAENDREEETEEV